MSIIEEDKLLSGNASFSIKELIFRIQDWYRYLVSKWILILIVAVFGVAVGLLASTLKKPVYIAATTFVLEESEKSGGLGQYAGIASMVGIDVGGGGAGIFQGDNILELYKSRTMIEKTLLTPVILDGKEILLVDKYIQFNNLREKWSKNPQLKNIKFEMMNLTKFNLSSLKLSRLQDSVLSKIVDDINENYLSVAKPDKKLSMIRAELHSKDEFFALNFNTQIVKNVNDFYIQTKTKKSQNNVAILQKKTDSVRTVMNGAIYSAAAVADATPNLNITRQIQRAAPVQRSQFTAETNKAVLSELVKNLELSKISLLKETPLIQVIDEPILPLKTERLGKIKGMLLGLFSFVFLCIVILISKKIYYQIINS